MSYHQIHETKHSRLRQKTPKTQIHSGLQWTADITSAARHTGKMCTRIKTSVKDYSYKLLSLCTVNKLIISIN